MAHLGRTRASRSSLTPPTGGAAWIGIEQEQRVGARGGSTRTTVRISPARRDAAAAAEWGRRREGPRPSQRRQRRAVIGLRDAATADALDPSDEATARRVERVLADLARRPAGGPAGPAIEEAAAAAAGADGRRLLRQCRPDARDTGEHGELAHPAHAGNDARSRPGTTAQNLAGSLDAAPEGALGLPAAADGARRQRTAAVAAEQRALANSKREMQVNGPARRAGASETTAPRTRGPAEPRRPGQGPILPSGSGPRRRAPPPAG